MSRQPTFPDTFEHARRLSIADLKSYGYFDGVSGQGTITFTRRGEVTLTAAVRMMYLEGEPDTFLMEYTYQEQLYSFSFQMVSVPSNLGKGKVWYFVCPHTDKRCRILFGFNQYFGHRTMYYKTMYDIQLYSENYRKMVRGMKESEWWPSSRPMYYAGKMTRPYRAYLKREEKEVASCHFMTNNLYHIL